MDSGWLTNEPLGLFVTEMIEAGFTDKAERNEMILKSEYANDSKIQAAILLFG